MLEVDEVAEWLGTVPGKFRYAGSNPALVSQKLNRPWQGLRPGLAVPGERRSSCLAGI